MDGLRGVAAICVVMFHAQGWFGILRPTKGYIAVDLFFALSGFVIASSYERRLRAGLTAWRFFLIRTIRLYPLYLIGLVAAAVVLTAAPDAGRRFIGGRVMDWTALPGALVALPGPFPGGAAGYVYPLNFPAWSLFFEFTINMIYVFTWRLWTPRLLAVAIALAGGVMLRFGGAGDFGWSWAGFPIGMLRCWYAFPFGVLIFKLHAAGYRAPPVPGLLCLAAFLALLLTPADYVVPVCAIAGAPLITAFAASAKTGRIFGRLFEEIGLISYALYALHIPLMNAARAALFRLHADPNAYVVGFGFLAVIIPVCALLDRHYDTPTRRLLTGMLLDAKQRTAPLRGRRPAISPATP